MENFDNENSVDVVFCGLIREIGMFMKSLNDLVLLRKEGLVNRIIFSTWYGEVQNNPDIYEFFKENNIEIVENESPEERGLASIWCQMKSLEEGLKVVNERRFVLKTRSDIYLPVSLLRKLFSEKERLLRITKNLPKGNIFKHKIWTHFYELKTAFFMGDSAFFGYRDDLKKLINYDKSYENEYDISLIDHGEHIMRFIHPFFE